MSVYSLCCRRFTVNRVKVTKISWLNFLRSFKAQLWHCIVLAVMGQYWCRFQNDYKPIDKRVCRVSAVVPQKATEINRCIVYEIKIMKISSVWTMGDTHWCSDAIAHHTVLVLVFALLPEGNHSEENASVLLLAITGTLQYKITLFFFFFIFCMFILKLRLLLLEAAPLPFNVYLTLSFMDCKRPSVNSK